MTDSLSPHAQHTARIVLWYTLSKGLTLAIFGLVFNLYLYAEGFDRQFIGIINAMSAISSLFAAVPVGLLGDRIGQRPLLLITGFVLNINQVLISAVAKYGIDGIDMPDPITMAIAIDRSLLLEQAHCFVDIETKGELTRGETVVDRFGVYERPANCTVGLRSDGPGFKRMLDGLLVE